MATIDREKLRFLLGDLKKSARQVSRGAGLGDTAVKDILSGKSRSPSMATVVALSQELGVSVMDLVLEDYTALPEEEANASFMPKIIPILGEVAAGQWREAGPAFNRMDGRAFLDLKVDGYENADLFALVAVGSSMNKVYPSGRILIVAPAAQAGVRWNDHVIVERRKGDFVETTVKELVNENGRVALWPRSEDPEFQAPFYIEGDSQDQTAPKIVGVVVADYGKRIRSDVFFTPPKAVDWAE